MDKYNESCEPMDIDLSGNSNNEMDISFNTSNHEITHSNIHVTNSPLKSEPLDTVVASAENTTQISNVKKFHIKIHKDAKSSKGTKIKIICSAFILLIAIITYQVSNIQCSNNIQPEELEQNLCNKLYGQRKAIDSLIEALNVDEKTKIFFFYGGTGVGKTFTASLILEHLGYYSNVYHYTMPSFMDTFTTDFMIGLTVCKHTIVIVDDLSIDLDIQTHIKDLITKSQQLDKYITIILIYNCDNIAKDFERKCNEFFPHKLLEKFHHIDALKKLIKFDPLREDDLKKCIEHELGNRKLTDAEFDRIAKNFNVSLDGCKGVYTKIKLALS